MSHLDRWMTAVICLGVCFFVAGCGDDDSSGGCTVTRDDAGGSATIECEDGTETVIEAPRAESCTVSEASDGTKTLECSDGTSTTIGGARGERGERGEMGGSGEQGSPGEPGAEGNPVRSGTVSGPGLKVEVSGVTIPEDLQPVVSLRIRDGSDRPLDRGGVYTAGAVAVNFVLARLSSDGDRVGHYVPYNVATVNGAMVDGNAPAMPNAMQARGESNGTWTEVDPTMGTYSYRFNQALPGDYDKSKTHTVAVYSSRTYDGVMHASNPIYHFRPDGSEVTQKREIVNTETCNNCHGTLAIHGGSRREVGLCITCHVEGTNDPESGNSLGMAEMVHQIHRGVNLPSVEAGGRYAIVGFMNSVHDYSDVVFPQAIENCEACHSGAPQSDRWKTELTRTACNGCHDRTSYMNPAPAGFTLHYGGQQTTDTLCVNCHGEGQGPIATIETDVTKVHRKLTELPVRDLTTGAVTSEPPRLSASVVSVTGTSAAATPVVTFTVTVDDMPRDIVASPLNRLRFTFAGPTTDYAGYVTFTAQGTGAVGILASTGTPGEFTWIAPGTITTIATSIGTSPAGSFAVGMEGRMLGSATLINGTLNNAVNYPLHNDVFYFPVTDAEAVPRREAVVVEKCNDCHQDLSAHGGSRNDPEYCVICHNANNDSEDVPLPAAGLTVPTASVQMSFMIHRIHMGHDGANPYEVAGHDYSEVLYPNDPRDCNACHVESQYRLPLADNLLPMRLGLVEAVPNGPELEGVRVDGADYFIQPTTAACTGCHDTADALAHAETMTTAMGQESCASCHGAGQAFDIDRVHARPGL